MRTVHKAVGAGVLLVPFIINTLYKFKTSNEMTKADLKSNIAKAEKVANNKGLPPNIQSGAAANVKKWKAELAAMDNKPKSKPKQQQPPKAKLQITKSGGKITSVVVPGGRKSSKSKKRHPNEGHKIRAPHIKKEHHDKFSTPFQKAATKPKAKAKTTKRKAATKKRKAAATKAKIRFASGNRVANGATYGVVKGKVTATKMSVILDTGATIDVNPSLWVKSRKALPGKGRKAKPTGTPQTYQRKLTIMTNQVKILDSIKGIRGQKTKAQINNLVAKIDAAEKAGQVNLDIVRTVKSKLRTAAKGMKAGQKININFDAATTTKINAAVASGKKSMKVTVEVLNGLKKK